MKLDEWLRLIAGSAVFITLVLGVYHAEGWFLFTGFVAVNLIQSAFSGWCPMMTLLRKLGVRA